MRKDRDVTVKAYEVTGVSEWVAGRRVKRGDVLMLTDNQAAYEIARGLLRPAGSAAVAATNAEKPKQRRRK